MQLKTLTYQLDSQRAYSATLITLRITGKVNGVLRAIESK